METTKHNVEVKTQATSDEPKHGLPIKKYIMYILIGGLVLSALISIIAVLMGEFSNTIWRAFGTTVTIMIHSLIGLLFLSVKRDRTLSNAILMNTIFTLVIASMITSIISIWAIVPGEFVRDLYRTYLLVFIATLIIAGLMAAHIKDKVVGNLAYATSGIVVIAFASLLPWVYATSSTMLPEFYYRVVAALFILMATLITLTVIFERMLLMKHPELKKSTNPGDMPVWVKVLLGVLIFIFGGWMIIPLLIFILGSAFSY